MGLSNRISIMAQLKNDQVFSHGTQHSGTQVLSVKQDLGLSVMALGYDHSNTVPAHEAVEILLDDIAINLDSKEKRKVLLTNESLARLCLRESIDNINDYLVSNQGQRDPSKSEKMVGLGAILLQDNQVNCIATNDIYCFIFEGNELLPLVAPFGNPDPIGADSSFQAEVVSHDYSRGNILIMISAKDLNTLGLDFVRVTLSRFEGNMEMALRQISVRMRRNGSKRDPALILCCV